MSPATATATATVAVTPSGAATAAAAAPVPVRGRRSRRICIDAHTEFVATLVDELKASVARLQRASAGLADGDPQAGPAGVERETRAITRLVALLEAIDGPDEGRRLAPVSLAGTVLAGAAGLDVPVLVTGQPAPEMFVADATWFRTGLEFLILGLSGDGSRTLAFRIGDDRSVTLTGSFDLADPRRTWQLRCARRVLEAEGIRFRLSGGEDLFRVQLTVGR